MKLRTCKLISTGTNLKQKEHKWKINYTKKNEWFRRRTFGWLGSWIWNAEIGAPNSTETTRLLWWSCSDDRRWIFMGNFGNSSLHWVWGFSFLKNWRFLVVQSRMGCLWKSEWEQGGERLEFGRQNVTWLGGCTTPFSLCILSLLEAWDSSINLLLDFFFISEKFRNLIEIISRV